MTDNIRLSPEADAALDTLDLIRDDQLLRAIDDAINLLATEPGSAAARRRSFQGAGFGMTVRTPHENWLIVWEPDPADPAIIRVRYIGPDPFA